MAKNKKQIDIERLLPGVKKGVSLKDCTSFKIGGKAKFFFTAKTEKDLILAVNVAKRNDLPFFILGGGSNLLVSDTGYRGLVIKIKNEKLNIKKRDSKFKIYCESGVYFSKLFSECLKRGFKGLEWAVGIPGSVGGAVRGNAGAFSKSIADNIQAVRVYDAKSKKIKTFKNKDCRFGYKDSIFKKNKNLIIISVIFDFKKGNKKEIKDKVKNYLNYRKEHQPLNFPSAGSIFVNPKGYFAGELIEKCGLKGKKIGRTQISKIHANFIVNLGGARTKDVKKLIDLAKKKVRQKFSVILKEEIEHLF